MDVLTPEQKRFYEENGYLLASGLIPDDIAEAAEAAMWREMGLSPDDPAGWSAAPRGHGAYESPGIVAVYTPAFLTAAMALAGEPDGDFRPPRRAYAINIFPSDEPWSHHGPHIDHAIKEHGHKTFPRAFRIATMTFLSDVPPHGGGTIVWPGGHRRLRALAESDPERYEYMWVLNGDMGRVGLSEPVELTPRRGDVLFYDCLCPHSGSRNVSDRPRLALNAKW